MSLKVAKVGQVLGGEVCITLESPSLEKVISTDAKQLAIRAASMVGVLRGGFNKQSGAYPVGPDGQTEEDIAKWPLISNLPGAAYRNDIIVKSSAIM